MATFNGIPCNFGAAAALAPKRYGIRCISSDPIRQLRFFKGTCQFEPEEFLRVTVLSPSEYRKQQQSGSFAVNENLQSGSPIG
ncbi:MAG TPA: hypothetical protein PKD17_08945 [Cellvibrionaceae bacterium]|nr:hypothetical protein [Cellvibrionaceae bacterium]HMW71933.1 hypothetical protein [Cellvibrionaceae bacterium]HMY40057.1 hypothetical protein [Marinagarivorans sp.]HNG59117.1 hypothetical protein [Cellvibrionaceae bacterium]